MANLLHKKSILHKTVQFGGWTLVSRFLGILRESLQGYYLGAGAASDAFITAYKIPNSLRKIFAEGALSAAFVPTLVQVVRQKGHKEASSLMSLAFIFFEGLVLLLCALTMWKAEFTLSLIAPGFSHDQVVLGVPLLRILMPFIFFLSTSALLAGALQSVGHFFVPAFSPVLLNLVFITGLLFCIQFGYDVTYLCFFILSGGLLQLIAHISAYTRLHFSFAGLDRTTWQNFKPVLSKFLLGSLSMSIVEINLFIDTSFASYLPEGSISLIYLANRFMGIPLGVFAVAFSTILLPHLSQVSMYAPKRLSFYLLEASKLVVWVTVPVTLLMCFLSEKIFYTLFLSKKFVAAQVVEASHILIAFLVGLFFFSLNKILLNMYYALHVAWIPALISVIATAVNIILNWAFMDIWHATGLAVATTVSSIVQTIFFLIFLRQRYNFTLYVMPFLNFLMRYMVQLALVTAFFVLSYYGGVWFIATQLPAGLAHFLLYKIGFWLWVGPLCGASAFFVFYTRSWFSLNLYFLD
ncbi:MAG TPA: murein biosynthesis integral membrane protein MurJ [Candidatus Limnocylindria bacterium]|nr:murein biosynthesis integral membrane protein MurJ [Candidatus Limnocylindria bacterium]